MVRLFLCGGFQLLRLLDHTDNLIIFSTASSLRHLDDALAFLHDGSCIDIAARALYNRHGFPSHGCLIDGCLSGFYPSIQWNDVRCTDDNRIPRLYLLYRHEYILARISSQPDLVHLQGHGTRQISH